MFIVSSPSDSETDANLANTLRDEPRTTTTSTQSNSERRMSDYNRTISRIFIFVDPRQWNSDEVLRWFQSNKLNEYRNS